MNALQLDLFCCRRRTTSHEKTPPPSSEQSRNEANTSAGRSYVTCAYCGNSFAPKVLFWLIQNQVVLLSLCDHKSSMCVVGSVLRSYWGRKFFKVICALFKTFIRVNNINRFKADRTKHNVPFPSLSFLSNNLTPKNVFEIIFDTDLCQFSIELQRITSFYWCCFFESDSRATRTRLSLPVTWQLYAFRFRFKI